MRELHACEVEWTTDAAGRPKMVDVPGSDFVMDVDLVLLAMGFVHPVHEGLVEGLGLDLDDRGNINVGPEFATSEADVFACGDAADGASLVVRAIDKGRRCAAAIDGYLQSYPPRA